MNTNVLLRKSNTVTQVAIKELKHFVSSTLISKWQKSIDLLVEISNAKAALIMQITQENMEVFLKSSNADNPYPENGKDALGHGLYCETVIGTDAELYVANSLNDEKWKDNPDVELNMISYLGYPIHYPDGAFFGTICILNDEAIERNANIVKWIKATRDMMEDDLKLLIERENLKLETNHDFLTGLPNRKALTQFLQLVHADFKRGLYDYGLAMLDLKHFKQINDMYGHSTGDEVLISFASIVSKRLRSNDMFARIGGDEFVLVAKKVDEKNMKQLIESIQKAIKEDKTLAPYNIDISYGFIISNKRHVQFKDLLEEADKLMYQHKKAF